MKSLPILIALISSICLIQAANILVMLPNCMYSHVNNFMPIFKGLAAKGHNVTMVSAFPQKKPLPNLNDIVLPNFSEEVLATAPTKNLLELDGVAFRLIGLWMIGLAGTKRALEDDTIQRLIRDEDSKFDLVILETWFIQEAFVAFGHKFNAPVVNLMPSYLFPQAAHLSGNYLPCTYVPISKMIGGFSDRMTFFQRALNCFNYMWDVFIGEQFYLRLQEYIMREYFIYPGSESLPPLVDMLRNTSLTLTDFNFALGYPMPLHKNVIEFGGVTVKKTEKLPADLQDFMDNAKDGVIYFSFGSHAKVSFLNPEAQRALMTALGKIKQKVLLKLEDSFEFQNLAADNILIRNWFPQPAVVAHPNCKLFITHGGLHGLMEAIYNSVPMIVIPLFGDQPSNAKFVEVTETGYVLSPHDITEDNLLYAIQHVLSNPSYKEKLKERSAIFKDEPPINSLDSAIYWIEYVIRHKGAPHLRPAVLDLHWYQYLMLDVIAFYILITVFIIFMFIIFLRLVCIFLKCIFCNNNSDSRKDKSKSKKE